LREIYQRLFDIIANPNAPKPYRDLLVFMKTSGRSAEAAGIATLLKNVFDENEEPEPALSERRRTGADNQNAIGSEAVRRPDDRG
jgi:hypothetical protein